MTPRLRVLVVEDDVDMGETMLSILADMDCDVHLAKAGLVALHLAAVFLPDIIFIDIGLPDMNGCDVVIAMRKLPGLEKAVFVAMTGGNDPERIRQAGFDQTKLKPFALAELEQVINSRGSPPIGRSESVVPDEDQE